MWVRYVLGGNGIDQWQSIGGLPTSDPAICSGPAGTFVVRPQRDNASLPAQVQRRLVVDAVREAGRQRVVEPDRDQRHRGVSVLFVGSDKALRTFRFANGSWGPEQFIRGGFAPVRGGG